MNKPAPHSKPAPDDGAQPSLYPLSQVAPGTSVRIKQISGTGEMASRLREMGFCEEQRIKLLARHASVICQVCNSRLGISEQLAKSILVEPLTPQRRIA
ncbi:MAG: ferrous iron transport protein A [Pedosphaera sp.]|nr:ferrous iron transport protein A [Pedosphaera sp.]